MTHWTSKAFLSNPAAPLGVCMSKTQKPRFRGNSGSGQPDKVDCPECLTWMTKNGVTRCTARYGHSAQCRYATGHDLPHWNPRDGQWRRQKW